MSGIVNGGQHCYVNSLMQCLSINQNLFTALNVHSQNHVEELGTGQRCVVCSVHDLLLLLRSRIPTTVTAEYMAEFCNVLNIDPLQPGDPREILHYFEEHHEQITSSYSFSFVQEIICLRCQGISNVIFNDTILTMEQDVISIEQGITRFTVPEIIEDYNCRPCGGMNVAQKTRRFTRLPEHLALHKIGASQVELQHVVRLNNEIYELIAFIEYVGRIPSADSRRVRAHYIGYRRIQMQWIRNDDERCHITQVEGSYKTNMAFYKRIADAVHDEFALEDEGILRWQKSVVIRGVYKPPARGRGRGCSRGVPGGRLTRSATQRASIAAENSNVENVQSEPDEPDTSKNAENDNGNVTVDGTDGVTSTSEQQSTELTLDEMYIMGESSSYEENESDADPSFSVGHTSSTRTSFYETRSASTSRAAAGSQTAHFALDVKGNPFLVNPHDIAVAARGRGRPRGRARGSRRRGGSSTGTAVAGAAPGRHPVSGTSVSVGSTPLQDAADDSSPLSDDDPQSTDVLDSGEATDQVGEGASSNEGSSSGASRDYRKVVVGPVKYARSSSPVFSDGGNSSVDSASTVELTVSQSPPKRRFWLRSDAKQVTAEAPQPNVSPPASQVSNDVPDVQELPEPVPGTSTATDEKSIPKQKKPRKRRKKSQKKKVVIFQTPTQRSVRRDKVDEQCRTLNIKYRRWPGNTQPKNYLHKSHCRFLDGDDGYFPERQVIPGDCVLCPQQKYLQDNWDKRRHYQTKHQQRLLVLDDIVMLQCKCSAVRSRGWDRDHSTRNAHYHCSVCHWPRDKTSQIYNHIRTIHDRNAESLQHLLTKA